jgi:exodeoxyribonuclease VII large subunit
MMEDSEKKNSRRVYSVAELTREVRYSLETSFASVWVGGEISDFRRPMSGHMYFNLKDRGSQLRAVMFKGSSGRLRFEPSDGMQVVAHGRISMYEARGDCQLICDWLEPLGAGALQAAFEELKRKLEAEGLFDPARKRPLPMFPSRVGLITSPSGAAVRDFIRTATRRFPGVDLLLAPVRVQGEEAAGEIARAIGRLNSVDGVEVIAVVRGGGGMEDLWPFNEERLVRAVAGSKVPVVSGVGHETDYTLCDFVADTRALTPTDAARLCVPDAGEIRDTVLKLSSMAASGLRHCARDRRLSAERLAARLDRMSHLADDARQRVEDLAEGSRRASEDYISGLREKIRELAARSAARHPRQLLGLARAKCMELEKRSGLAASNYMKGRHALLAEQARLLNNLSPLSVLDRGYSLSFDTTGRIVRDSASLSPGDPLRVRFASGEAETEVKGVKGKKQE